MESTKTTADVLEEPRPCPKCGKMLKVKYQMCPDCHYTLHWLKSANHKWVNFVQSPFRRELVLAFLVLAILGQLLLFFTSNSMKIYIQVPPLYNYLVGHLLKILGEGGMIYCLLFGLRFEMLSMTKHVACVLLLFVIYHLFAMSWPFASVLPVVSAHVLRYYQLGVCLQLIFMVLYGALGLRLNFQYNGRLSETGLLLALVAGLSILFNGILRLLGKNFYADFALTAIYIFYLYMLWARLLDHQQFKKAV